LRGRFFSFSLFPICGNDSLGASRSKSGAHTEAMKYVAGGVVKERFITPHKIDPIFIPVYREIQRLLYSLLECGTINTFKQADK